jgi:hypothetical protein
VAPLLGGTVLWDVTDAYEIMEHVTGTVGPAPGMVLAESVDWVWTLWLTSRSAPEHDRAAAEVWTLEGGRSRRSGMVVDLGVEPDNGCNATSGSAGKPGARFRVLYSGPGPNPPKLSNRPQNLLHSNGRRCNGPFCCVRDSLSTDCRSKGLHRVGSVLSQAQDRLP